MKNTVGAASLAIVCGLATTATAQVAGLGAGGCNFATPRAAIQAATPNDTVFIRPGTYNVGATIAAIADGITIEPGNSACNGPETSGQRVVLNATANQQLMTISAGINVTMKEITLRNGQADFGGNLRISAGSTLDATDVDIEDGHATKDGGGVYLDPSATANFDGPSARGSKINGNTADRDGGAFYVWGPDSEVGAATLNLTNRVELGTDSANTAVNGGGVFARSNSIVNITDPTGLTNHPNVANNVAESLGGGVFANDAFVTIEGAVLSANDAARGGAIAYDSAVSSLGTRISISNSRIEDNTAFNGGGIAISGRTLSVENSLFDGNAASSSGGGLLVSENGAANIGGSSANGSDFVNNSAISGGAASCDDGNLLLIVGNVVVGGSAALANTAANGAGLDIQGDCLLTSVAGTNPGAGTPTISHNVASVTGGGIRVNDGRLSMFDSLISHNTAVNGAGVRFNGTDTLASGAFHDVTFDANAASGDGGALYIEQADVLIDGALIDANAATAQGAGVFVTGGSTDSLQTTVDLVDTIIRLNVAGGNGGGLAVIGGAFIDPDNAVVNVSSVRLRENSAAGVGGGVFLDMNATLTSGSAGNLDDCQFECLEALLNTAPDGSALYAQVLSTVDASRFWIHENVTSLDDSAHVHVNNATYAVSDALYNNNVGTFGPSGSTAVGASNGGVLNLAHSTIADNTAGGVVVVPGSTATLSAMLVHFNSFGITGSVTAASACNSTQDALSAGTGNVLTAPIFTVASARSTVSDYLQTAASTSRDVCATFTAADDLNDISQNTRPTAGSSADRGCHEQ